MTARLNWHHKNTLGALSRPRVSAMSGRVARSRIISGSTAWPMARNSAVGEKVYENILKDVTISSVSSDDFLSMYLESSGIARAGFDRVRRRIEAVVAEERDGGGLELPEPDSGYPMFPGRRVAAAVEWYQEHWGRYVPVGLDQAELRRLDKTLMKALENEFEGRKVELASIVPPKKARRSNEVAAAGLDPANPRHRQRVSDAIALSNRMKSKIT